MKNKIYKIKKIIIFKLMKIKIYNKLMSKLYAFELDHTSTYLRNRDMHIYYQKLNKITHRKKTFLPKLTVKVSSCPKNVKGHQPLKFATHSIYEKYVIRRDNAIIYNKLDKIHNRSSQAIDDEAKIQKYLDIKKHTREEIRKIKANLLKESNQKIRQHLYKTKPVLNALKMKSDFIATRGYLTEHAYLRNLEDLGINPKELAEQTGEELGNAIDAKRMSANALEVEDCIKAATTDYVTLPKEGELSKYAQMVREAITQKIDWHENAEYNNGKSANERYMTEVFETNKNVSSRNHSPLSRLVGDRFGIADVLKENAQRTRNKWVSFIILSGVTIAAIGTGIYYRIRHNNKTEKIENNPVEKSQENTMPNLVRPTFNSFNKIA